MDTLKVWETKFPDVSFSDKICIVFNDGKEQIEKHLYLDDDLSHINWDDVSECFDV